MVEKVHRQFVIKKKEMKVLIWILLSSTSTFFVVLFLFFSDSTSLAYDNVSFQTRDKGFTFTVISSKGRDCVMMENQFATYRSRMQDNRDTILFRTTSKNYLNISKWSQYKHMPAWQYPYLWNH